MYFVFLCIHAVYMHAMCKCGGQLMRVGSRNITWVLRPRGITFTQ